MNAFMPNAFYPLPSSGAGFDLWRMGVKTAEMWVGAVSTIAMRGDLFLTAPPWSPKLMTEWNRMFSEKAMAGMLTTFELQRMAFNYGVAGNFNPLKSGNRLLTPWHSRATSNSRRLSKRRR